VVAGAEPALLLVPGNGPDRVTTQPLMVRVADWLDNAGARFCWWAWKLREYANRNMPKCPDCRIAPWDGSDDSECPVCKAAHE
jgi:hypothetical protein